MIFLLMTVEREAVKPAHLIQSAKRARKCETS